MTKNQLIITADGDSLENGFWEYSVGKSGVSQSGNYENGYKIGKWNYSMDSTSINIGWHTEYIEGVKLNIPDYYKLNDDIVAPVILQADIEDGDRNTYLVLLRYNIDSLHSSVYDYLYQYNDSWKKNTEEKLTASEFKKFYFKNIELFRVKVETQKESNYQAVSYIFVVDNFLFDLTYKNKVDRVSKIELEIFNDILYSFECDGIDIFDYNNRQYLKEENLRFE